MNFQLVYEYEPVSERGASRVGGDNGLYRIAVYKKHQDGRKELSHYLEGEFDKPAALKIVSQKNQENNR